MIIKDNQVYSEKNSVLWIKPLNKATNFICLGFTSIIKDGEPKLVEVKLDDIEEGFLIPIENKQYFFKANSYGELVTALIRHRYSLDEELAIYANSLIGSHQETLTQFQDWRKHCKEIAKKYYE